MRYKHLLRLGAVLASIGLVAAACSGNAGTSSSPSATSGAPSVTAAASGAPSVTAAPSPSAVPTVIQVGVVGSFSGATAFYGQEAERGTQIAVDELNAQGGKYIYQYQKADDACTPDGGAAAYGHLIDVQKVDVILGSPCSSATLGGISLLPPAQVPNVIVSSTNPTITAGAGVGGNQYIWRVNISDAVMATVWSKYIADQGITKIATIAANNDYGRGAITAYKAEFPKNNVQAVAEEYYTQGSGEFRSLLTSIGGSGAQAMLIVGAHQDAAVMMRQFKELGMTIRVFARGDVVSRGFQDTAGDPNLGNGIQEANNWDSTYSAYPDFEKAYEAKFGGAGTSYSVQAWIGMHVIDLAAQAGGPGRAGIQSGLAGVNWTSPIGPIAFDDHHQAHHDMFILSFQDGKIVLVNRMPTN